VSETSSAPLASQPVAPPNGRWKKIRRWITLVILLAIAGAAGFEGFRLRQASAATTLPTAPVRKGDFSVIVRCRGELKARRSRQIVAPMNVPDLRIVWAAAPSSKVKRGEVVIKFDQSSAKQQLQEKDAALQQAQATLDQAVAQARITTEQDKLDSSTARYNVEKAKLEVSKQEIVSALQGEESKIDLALSEKDLLVKEAGANLHAASDRSKIASLTRARDHAQSDVDLTKRRLEQMEITAPLDGLIVYLPNYSAGWMNAKPFKVGDSVWQGASVAEIPDLDTLEMEGKIEEIDRGRITVGNSARVRIDSLPELTLEAKLSLVSPLTEQTFEWPPTSSFRGYSRIDKPDPRLRPGMNGSMDVEISRIPNATSVPAKAIFTRNAKPVVFVAVKGGYQAKEVQILARNPDEVAIQGIDQGNSVALVDPEKKDRKQ
jgi:multidrug efflux pump subunit AcrA (membrane-fusion protein)